jgi:hypothetical protein
LCARRATLQHNKTALAQLFTFVDSASSMYYPGTYSGALCPGIKLQPNSYVVLLFYIRSIAGSHCGYAQPKGRNQHATDAALASHSIASSPLQHYKQHTTTLAPKGVSQQTQLVSCAACETVEPNHALLSMGHYGLNQGPMLHSLVSTVTITFPTHQVRCSVCLSVPSKLCRPGITAPAAPATATAGL